MRNEYPFPRNISESYKYALEKLQNKHPNVELIITKNSKKQLCLATESSLNIGSLLYYIPINQVCKLLHSGKDKELSDMLVSALAYLYQIVRVPYYRHAGSFLYNMYFDMEEQLKSNWEGDKQTKKEWKKQLKLAEYEGDLLEKRISKRSELEQFENRILKYHPINDVSQKFLTHTTELLQLYKEFPNTSFFENIPDREEYLDSEDSYDHGGADPMTVDQYLSFVHDPDSKLFEDMEEYINSFLQECTVVQAPTAYQYFDTQHPTELHEYEFENRFLSLLNNFCLTLNNLYEEPSR